VKNEKLIGFLPGKSAKTSKGPIISNNASNLSVAIMKTWPELCSLVHLITVYLSSGCTAMPYARITWEPKKLDCTRHTILAVRVHGVVVQTRSLTLDTSLTNSRKVGFLIAAVRFTLKVTYTECETWSSL
jgi:hypothetical protein